MHFESNGRVRLVSIRSTPSRRLSRHRGPVYLAMLLSPRLVLHSPLFRRPASVVWNRRDIGDAGNLEPRIVQRPNRRLASGSRALDHHLQILQSIFRRRFARLCRSYLSREWGALAGTLEAARTGCRPSESITLPICNGNQCIVEGRMYMDNSIANCATNTLLCSYLRFRHWIAPILSSNRTTWTLSRTGIRMRTLSSYRKSPPMSNAPITPKVH